MYCEKCGRALENNDRFCSGCGSVNPDFPFDQNGQLRQNGQFPGNSGFGNAQEQPYMNGNQTFSPYQNSPEFQQNIPPVYEQAENGHQLGFAQNNDIGISGNGPEMPAKTRKKNRNSAQLAVGIIAVLVVIPAVISAAAAVFRTTRDVHDSPTVTINKNIPDIDIPDINEPDTYLFNAMNNIKEPEVIWETDMIRVTTQNIYHGGEFFSNAQFQILVENKSDRDIRIRAEEFSVNGFEFDSSLSDQIPAGKSKMTRAYIDLRQMEQTGIENINEITMVLSTSEDKTYEKLEKSELLTVKTKNTDTDEAFEPSMPVYDQDGIKIGYEGIHLEKNDSKLYLYLENNTDEILEFRLEDVSVNDKMLNTSFYQTVYPGHKVISDSYISSDQLSGYRIKDSGDIKNVEFTVLGGHEEKYDTVFNSGAVRVDIP